MARNRFSAEQIRSHHQCHVCVNCHGYSALGSPVRYFLTREALVRTPNGRWGYGRHFYSVVEM